jgi:hypothetical protein
MEQSSKVLALGEAIVKDLSDSHNTTARWMAYYVAQLMEKARSAQGKDKEDYEKICFDTILELWKNKSFYPDDSLPFRDYDSIFKTLRRIDPSADMPFYVNKGKEITERNEEVQTYINIALVIDKAVKIWFEYILNQAIQAATGDTALDYLQAILNLKKDDFEHLTIKVILRGLENEDDSLSDSDTIERKVIAEKIEILKAFDSFNKEMLSVLEGRLQNMQGE